MATKTCRPRPRGRKGSTDRASSSAQDPKAVAATRLNAAAKKKTSPAVPSRRKRRPAENAMNGPAWRRTSTYAATAAVMCRASVASR